MRAGLRLLQREGITLTAAPGHSLPEVSSTPDWQPAAGAIMDKADQQRVPVIGIGASAGGIQAFQSFFENMPADSGFALVVMLHLPADRKSMLPELIGRWTAMPVSETNDGCAPASELRLYSAARDCRDLPRWPLAPPLSRCQRAA